MMFGSDDDDDVGAFPLHDAAEVGDVELITKLLAKGSNDGDFNPVRHATGQIGAGRVSRHTVSRQNPPSQVTPTQP